MLLFFLGLSAAAWPAAPESCSRDWVCVRRVDSGDRIDVVARNRQPYPVTISLRMAGRWFGRGARRTVTRTVPGDSEVVMKSFVPLQNAGPGNYRFYYDWTVGDLEARHDDSYIYRLPYAEGVSFRVLQGFGSKFSHTGLEEFTVDFDMPVGTRVHAAREGVVAMVEESHNSGCWTRGCGRHANYVVILHADGTTGEYYHLSLNGALVEQGERVERGQLIALSGNTGHTTTPHLHFGVYRPKSWGQTQSLSVRFASDRGVLERPRSGRRYRVK